MKKSSFQIKKIILWGVRIIISGACLLLGVIAFLFYLGPSYQIKEFTFDCEGDHPDYYQPTSKELDRILKTHLEWLQEQKNLKSISEEAKKDVRRARLCKAKLKGIDLRNTNLAGADLRDADLTNAQMTGINLSHADLSYANLRGAIIEDANLFRAKLSQASLLKTKLKNSRLSNADLTGALIEDADLTNVDFFRANFNKTMYEPIPQKNPKIDEMAYAKNLHLIYYIDFPSALNSLRKDFKERGYLRSYRETTYALKHTQIILPFHYAMFYSSSQIDYLKASLSYLFNYSLFELTTMWGMRPERALGLICVLIFFFAMPYIVSLKKKGTDGIWITWPKERVRLDLGNNHPKLICQAPLKRAIIIGLYFSILSAFKIGWKDFNFASWINNMQFHEYQLTATGWVRTISSIQSLVSVYLFAIWILTQFGHPFE